MSQRPPRMRRNRMDGEHTTKSIRLSTELARALAETAATVEFRNNQSAVVEQALVEFFNRRRAERAA